MKSFFKKKGTVLLIIVALLTTVFSVTFSRYFTSFNKKIVLKVREPFYTVIFNSNGGVETMSNQNFVYGESDELSDNLYKKTDYYFKEWNTKADGTGEKYLDKAVVTNLSNVDGDEINLYAIWKRVLKVGDVVNYKSGLSDNGWIYIGEEDGYYKLTSIAPLDELTIWGRDQTESSSNRNNGQYSNTPGFVQGIDAMNELAQQYAKGSYSVKKLARNISIEDIEEISGLTGTNCDNGSPYSVEPTYYDGGKLNASAGSFMVYDGNYSTNDLSMSNSYYVIAQPCTNYSTCRLSITNPSTSSWNRNYYVCTNQECVRKTSGSYQLKQSYYSYPSTNVENSVNSNIIFGENGDYNYFVGSEYVDAFRGDQIMYGFFTVEDGQLGNSDDSSLASNVSNYQNGGTLAVRPVIYLNKAADLVYNEDTMDWDIENSTEPSQFSVDSWETINEKVLSGNYPYKVGDTKCLALNGYTTTNDNGCDNGEFLVRVANTSTPEECNTAGFSQTACGFVIEFVDIITSQRMASSTSGLKGWPTTTLNTYLNNDIYNSFPDDLKNTIVKTDIVSSHEYSRYSTISNYSSKEKLYLLSSHEVFDNDSNSTVAGQDTAYDDTRQLDYYFDLGVSTTYYDDAVKYNANQESKWWLRSRNSANNSSNFLDVSATGTLESTSATTSIGVSPAFKIGKRPLNISVKLADGLIPVVISNDGTVTSTTTTDANWADYENQMWGNAVLVKDSGVKTRDENFVPGTVIDESDIMAYFVWIPRYEYKIWTLQNDSDVKIIDIRFQSVNEISLGTTVGSWLTHPAFWWDNNSDGVRDAGEELEGVWVGKFELTCPSGSTNGSTCSINSPTILPNTRAVVNRNMSTLYNAIPNIKYGLSETTDDIHMIKNIEWGALLYLYQSEYGSHTVIAENTNTNYQTGCGNGSGTSCSNQFGNSTSYAQSTTANISGVFDMVGGTDEYVMAGYNNTIGSSGFSKIPESKYYDKFTSTNLLTACNGTYCFGHALFETYGWNGDDNTFVNNSSNPWLGRGGSQSSGKTGAFRYKYQSGGAVSDYGTRAVLISY